MKPAILYCLGVRKLCPSGPLPKILFGGLLFFFLFQIRVHSQCAMACRSKGNISLGPYCEATILPSMLLTKGVKCPEARYRADVMDYNMKLIPTSPVITSEWIGKTVTVRVFDSTSLNSCWGTLYVEDKFPPVIECHTDTMYCNDIRYRDEPIFYDWCDTGATIRLVDEIFFPFYCDSFFVKMIVRAWSATDKYGNQTVPCYDTTWLRRVPIDSILFPKNYTVANDCHIECGTNYLKDAKGHPHPDVTDVPRIEGIPLWPDYNALCNVSTNYEDAVLIDNGCKKKILRMWRIVEWWCGSAVVRTHPQTIEIVDTEPPHFHCPYAIDASTNLGYGCLSRVYLPPLSPEDACQDSFSVTIHYPGGILKNQNGGYIELEVGDHIVVYQVFDACGNYDTCQVHVHVTDRNPPTMVCDQGIVVSLTRDDEVKVDAEVFDQNSHDDCHLKELLVRRMDYDSGCGTQDSLFRPYIVFCCDDVGQRVMVILRGIDHSGNFNDCMVEVEIQDKTPPVIRCPHDYTISCAHHLDTIDLSHYGGPYYSDNCIVQMVEYVDTFLNQCRLGYLERNFVITDNMGRKDSCVQRIYVVPDTLFTEDDITWPLDTTLVGCGIETDPKTLPVDYSYPRFRRVDCSLPATFVEDHEFRIIQDTAICSKILRKWKVIDWCQRTVDQYGNDSFAIWTHTQIIKIQNKLPPKLTDDCETVTVCLSGNDCLKARVRITHSAHDDCTPDDDLDASFKLDLFSDGFIDSVYHTSGSSLTWDGDLPMGEHRIIWVFEDLCGNKEVCDQLVRVINCKGPTAYCLSGIAINLSSMDVDGDGKPEGVADVWASDIDRGSYQYCGNPVVLSFSKDTTHRYIRFTCDSLGMRRVELWVTDRLTGLQDFCVSTVVVQDNNRICPRRLTGNIAGAVTSPFGTQIPDVNVTVENIQQTVEAEFTGSYLFPDMILGMDYRIEVKKEDNYSEGVSTLDIIQIQKHILAQKELSSPLEKLAADANGDKRITSADIASIRKIILGIHYKFTGSNSWKFIQKTYQFPDPSDPWSHQVPESYNIPGMSGDMMYLDFVGLKVGDVSQTAWGNLNQSKERSTGLVEFYTMETENSNRVPVYLSNDMELSGMQFTLHFDPRLNQFRQIESAALQIGSQHVNLQYLSDGILLVSWNPLTPQYYSAGTELFVLQFEENVDPELRASLSIGSDVLKSEAYDADWNIFSIKWMNHVQDLDAEVVFGVPRPNPFAEMTIIPMDVKNETSYTYRLYDMNGTELHSHSDHANAGRNYIKIRKSIFPKPGIYLLRLESGLFSKGFKLVVMEQ